MKVIKRGQDHIFKQQIDEERRAVLAKLNQLESALIGLRFEGKVFSFNHIRKIDEIVVYLRNKYQEHTRLDEKIIFPFLSKHIPKLCPVLHFLMMESQDFSSHIDAFGELLCELKKKNRLVLRNSIIERLKEKGVYLICLIRSHIQLEEEKVYRAIFLELHPNERAFLQKSLEMFVLKRTLRKQDWDQAC